jgi:hypothetical protein
MSAIGGLGYIDDAHRRRDDNTDQAKGVRDNGSTGVSDLA